MSAILIDGKKISENIFESLKLQISSFTETHNCKPGLAVVLVGEDKASRIYVKKKRKACLHLGIKSFKYNLEDTVSENELLALINELNNKPTVNGILVQLPLPSHINEKRIIEAIKVEKDVDGFTEENSGKLFLGHDSMIPCTPKGILRLLKEYKIEIKGKNAVVLGRSNIVGKPTGMLLMKEHATITYCHSQTRDLDRHLKEADIIIAAIGKAEFVKKEHIKKEACIIDVGINRTEDGRLVGDVCFEDASLICSYLTPVPGGVGPMTIAMLMENTLEAAKIQINK
ncbi:MAG: bifunctional methylenetetrahydrofolate dehydrogenase/methenyltetrahydrofolate cyclohydrolase FolD [Pseudomonadota bacterium]